MSNLMSKIYIGYVESIVKGRFGQPTLDLRIRVPSIHGTDGTKGVKNQHLPIARPLLAPGTQINKAKFVEHLEHINKVFVVFESGNYNKPFYLGITNSAIHEIEDAIDVLAAIAAHNIDPEAHADIRLEVEGLWESLGNKQDKVTGKGLSTNDFTDEYKNKVDYVDTAVDNIVGEVDQNTQQIINNQNNITQLQTDKLDKITTPTIDPTIERVYGTDSVGNQKEFNVAKFNYDNTIVMRDDIGRILDLVSHNESTTAHQDIRDYVDSKTMKLLNNGSTAALPKTTYRTFTVPSDSYAGKTVAVEIRYGNSSATTYTNQVVYVTLGTNTSTEASRAYPRFITLSEWDGEYLKHISVKTYVAAGTTSTINFGHVKTLIGRFTGSTIDWTTQANDNINVYIGKIWLVG